MKFEETLPALREGKKVRRKDSSWINFYDCIYVNWVGKVMPNRAYFEDYTLDTEDLDADDWEVVEEKKKVKLRDLKTQEQLEKWKERNCEGSKCKDCVFNQNKVNCIYVAYCWIKDKSIFSDKFLDQEIEIEVEEND